MNNLAIYSSEGFIKDLNYRLLESNKVLMGITLTYNRHLEAEVYYSYYDRNTQEYDEKTEHVIVNI